ncbi:hypothetical protein LUZ63_006319 [Rhynchospora breviuscula]|uniref:Auxin transport protein BIG n=1 Tax=Rhynchospora breviuscula TaxID=2022672 RepID=A0A9Q0CQA2_9POAL|nr:hypothetical protein LUZ63_006319 [Rhynchospora breviuscula]
MAEIARLFEILVDQRRIRADDLRSASARLGLERLLAILQAGVATEDQRAGFETWTGDQVDSLVVAVRAVVSAALSNPVELVEPLVIAIIEKALDFCMQFLEKSSRNGNDFSLQDRAAQFLDISLGNGSSELHDIHDIQPISLVVERLSSIPIISTTSQLANICYLPGFNCSKENKTSSTSLLNTLSSEFSQPISISKQPPLLNASSSLITSAARHLALVHLMYVPRLLSLCKSLLQPPLSSEKLEDTNLVPRISHCLKLLKLLKHLVVESPLDSDDTELLHMVASFVNSVPAVLKLTIDFGSSDSGSYENLLCSVLLKTIDEFLQFVRIAFWACDVYRTIEACLVASLFEILSVKSWQPERMSPSLRAPLVCSPRIVQYLLKYISAGWWVSRYEGTENMCDLGTVNDVPSCFVRSQKVSLLSKLTYEECLRLVSPPSEQWIDDLIHLVLFLHTLAVKSVAAGDKPRIICSKTSAVSDTESVISHDDEAIFGDLFAEGIRATGPSDASEKPVSGPGMGDNTIVSCSPIQVVVDLMSFLKTNIFSPEWSCKVHEDACMKVKSEHVNQLLSMLSCQNPSCAERILDPSQSSLNELCFDLLHALMVCCEIPLSLKEHLVHQVLLVENGAFVYNHYTLALVAHCLVSGNDLGSSINFRSGLFVRYLEFLLDKVNNVILTESNDLSVALPCAFHLEMLLMAFHLSSQADKEALVGQVFSTLKKMASRPPPGPGLSVWGLLVSRVFLLLRHMLLYLSSCPVWLLSRFRSKMREIPIRPGGSSSYMHDHLPSLVASFLVGIYGDAIRESPVTSSLLPRLIDVVPLNAAFCPVGLPLQNFGIDLPEMIDTISTILGFWQGQKAESADLLIVERYLFLLFWNTLLAIQPGTKCELGDLDANKLNLSDVRVLLSFSLSLEGGSSASLEEQIPPAAIVSTLNLLHSEISLHSAQVDSLDFLRRSAGLSLVLSVVNAGLDRFLRPDLPAGSFNNLGENVVKYLDEKQGAGFLNDLACVLETYLRIMQHAFLFFLNQASSSTGDKFSPVLLLKHTAFDKSKQDLFLGMVGFNLSRVETIYGLLNKLDGIGTKLGAGKAGACTLSQWLYHGLPIHPDSCNGTLLSCILAIGEVIGVIDGFLKFMGEKEGFKLEASVACRVLQLVMAVKNDRIFGSLSQKCDAVFDCLISKREHLEGYKSLFALKQLEEFLTHVTSEKGISCEMRELLISEVADYIEVLRKDSSKIQAFKFYLGCDDSGSQEAESLFSPCRADLLTLVNALDECQSETVNLKVIGLLVDVLAGGVCSSLKEKLRKRFLDMDTELVSHWLKARLLGTGSVGGSVRDVTVDFLTHLISPLTEMGAPELQTHLGKSMLVLLDMAFLQQDLQTAEPYFNFLFKLLSCESASMKLLLESTLKLMEKMVEKESLLPGLKFLLMFFEAVIGQSAGPNKAVLRKVSSKISSSSNVASGCMPSNKQLSSSSKNTDNLTIAADSVLVRQVDITSSGEEDEDDGTTDGELASVDRDHEEEDMNSERVLASKVCTFTSSGSNFMEQHWYFCYTCDLTVSKGCCSVCARVCHRGHRVVYSRSSRFFCDCGAGGVRGSSCQCLKPRKFTGHSGSTVSVAGNTTGFRTFAPYQDEADPAADSCSDLDDEVTCDAADCSFKLSITKELQDELPEILGGLRVESQIVEICKRLLPEVTSRREENHLKDKRVILGAEKRVLYTTDLFQLKKAFKSGSLDLKIKADYPNSRELKSHLSSGSLAKSLLSVSVRGKLAVGEGDKVAIFDIGQLIGQPTVTPVTADKTNVKPLSKNMVRFEIVHLMFNPLVESYLAVAGYEECQVLTVNSRGEVTDRLAIELALTDGAYVRKVEWVPGSQVQLMVASNKFVKIYDLSLDNISPVHYFTLENDLIVDAALVPASMGKIFLLVLSDAGILYKFEVSMEGDVGARTLTDVIEVEGKQIQSRGVSLHFSSTYRLLFLAYHDSTTLLGRLDPDSKILTEVSYVNEELDGKFKPAALHHWRELIAGSGIFSCQSGSKSNVILTVVLGPQELTAQNMKHSMGSNSATMVGVAAYKPLSKDKTNCLILYDDGSLHIFSYNDTTVENTGSAGTMLEQKKKLGPSILSSKAYTSANPEFPLDFFEKTVCITGDVRLSSDAYKGGDSESIKQRLASEDGYLEGPTSSGFKATVSNPNPDIVMVGCRIHVGNTSVSHIPSEVSLFHRTIKLDEGIRSWYDIPFTTAESLLADEEFTISVGITHDKLSTPRLDFLEIYGRAKDDFGWKEKMDEVLNLEASVPKGARSGKKSLTAGAYSTQEQVLADALNILAKVYILCGPHLSDVDLMEVRKLRCGDLLEAVFQSDREPLLQLAACRVLQAIFPKRETYYHVKDSLRLLGVIKSFPLISSRIGVGGAASSWVIKEFIAQIQAVSKISLNRKSNMAAFLQTNGSEVVDGLMEIFWGILNLERPDTQTINSLVVPCVDLIYSYAECLASIAEEEATTLAVAPAVVLLKKLLFAPYEAVQTSSSLAISSRLLQVPFPKQTMITPSDDVSESRVQSTPSDAAGSTANNNMLIEEDPSTSSVQYCCDGCSTVPIVRRRWHCTVCPDFDLCETCYEVLDADRLPPPHSRDHAMTAIPIELDSMGGDGTEIHFTLDELTDPSSVRGLPSRESTERGRESSLTPSAPSSIHVLEMTDAAELASQRVVSISASKRAVNSLLLRGLIEELNGWMEVTSGLRAVPIMQLFYRLSSAVGGPFMDGVKTENLDLERFVRWLLDEINLSRPFPSRARSPFGEVAILVFMFFTLMFRNWHQPSGSGSDGSGSQPKPDSHDKGFSQVSAFSATSSSSTDELEKEEFASQLVRACSCLRNQEFLNYLMDILQQLVQVFKTSSGSSENGSGTGPGCGSLLTVRRELPAGNFSPFFSDSYAKSHPKDLFADYHKLLLENTFRLVYSMVRPEKHDKSTEKDTKAHRPAMPSGSKDLKLEEYQDVLCSYISNPNTTFVRRYARRLFLHICGSKTQYYSIRDAWQYSHEVKKLYKIVNKSGGFKHPVPYERSVKLIKCLSTLCEVAASRPKNWQKYCLKHPDILPFLTNSVFYFGEESIVQSLKLLNLAFYTGKELNHTNQKLDSGAAEVPSVGKSDSKKKKKGEEGGESSSIEKSCVDMEHALEMFTIKDGALLRQFVDTFLLEWNSASVRNEAKCVLYGVWHHARGPFKETILKALLHKVRSLPMYGQNIVEYTDLMAWLLGKCAVTSTCTGTTASKTLEKEREIVSRCLTSEVVTSIYETLHLQNELLANHPNSRIYNTLSTLVEFDGYYLESEPCVSCSCPDVPYTRMKLETIKSETKYTDNRIIVKCTGCFMIQSVTMNVHDARKSKSVKVLNLYYNNRPVADLSELKNNWSLWKRAKSCHLVANQTELKVEFPIPITACNLMIELDSFYENLQASSLESLQCPRCSRAVTDKHGICSNCHENAYQCRQCRNINYENLDSFLCNECGYSKYGRFEFHFMAKPSFSFDNMENDEDMRKGLAAIEAESENAHRRYQQLLGFKKPLVKLVSSIGEHEMDSQQKDTVQQMMVSLPGPSCKVNRKIALLGVLYGEKCKAAFDSVSKSVQTLQGLRRVLMTYLHHKSFDEGDPAVQSLLANGRSSNNCYGCATTFVSQCLELLQVLTKHPSCKKQLISSGILSELFENNIHHGPRTTRVLARAVISAFSEGDAEAVAELNGLIKKKVMYCLEHHRSMDIASATREELLLLSETCALVDEFWESRLRVAFQILFSSIKVGAKHPAISENIILPCLRIVSQACTPPRSDSSVDGKEQDKGKLRSSVLQPRSDKAVSEGNEKGASDSGSRKGGQDIPLLSYSEWERGASYLDFVRRQYKVSQVVKTGPTVQKSAQKSEYLALKYGLRWKRRALRHASRSDFSKFALGSWVSELILSACSQSIRAEVSTLINLLFPVGSVRQFQLLNLLVTLLPATLDSGESAAEYFELFFSMVEPEAARLFLTVRGCLHTICGLITKEVANVESQERSLAVDISQGFILHKLIEMLNKFLEVPNIRARFMREELLSEVLEAFLIIQGLVVQKTKLISDCNRLLKELLDGLVLESTDNKWQFIRACVAGLQRHAREQKRRTSLFILEQLCNMICPTKPEPVYLLVLNKAHTQEEFIRGSMTKNPYSSAEIGPLMRDVKNKICHQLDLLGLVEDDYGMELLVAGNIISLDLSISQVYEQVCKKHHSGSHSTLAAAIAGAATSAQRDSLPMTVTYRLQGLDGEATEPMIKELEEEKEESQDPEVEFAIAGAVRECGGLEIILSMIQRLREEDLRSNQEELSSVLNLLRYCCKIRENRRALLLLGALGLLLEIARRAFSLDAMESAEGILLIVESLTIEANESDISITQSVHTSSTEETAGVGEQSKKIVLMFLERLCHPVGMKRSNKQLRNDEMVARILPYLTYGEPSAMDALIQHFEPYLNDWSGFDQVQNEYADSPKDENLGQKALCQRSAIENFVRVSESLNSSSCGERLKDMILSKGITAAAVRCLRDSFGDAESKSEFFKNHAEWVTGLRLPSVPLILSMLRGLSKGHFGTQKCIDEEGLLPLLHALEGVVGEKEIGAKAENLLDTLANKEDNGDGFLGQKINELRRATREEMRRRALKKREVLLQGLGMREEFGIDGGKRILVSQPFIEGLDDVEEETDGLACMVCREGYTLRPNDILGVYSFGKRVNLGATGSGGSGSGSTRGDCVYTTVSHFNIIHFQCHQEAKRADSALRNPKKEWEGAALRNNETLCNCIFPLRGPAVPLGQYARCVDQYWDNLSALGRADGSRIRLLTYDIVLMLARFATGASFNCDSRGGGRESNSRYLPFMVQMASYLLDQGNPNPGQQRRTMAKTISTYLANNSASSIAASPPIGVSRLTSAAAPTEETVQFMMVNSLLSNSYEEWVQHRTSFLQRGIYHAYMQHKHNSSSDLAESKKLFTVVQPMLVYTGLIEQLQRFFKVNKRSQAKEEAGLEMWEVVMRERMVNIKEMVGFSDEMLEWLDDMTTASDLQEAFDVMGALGDVFSHGFTQCEDFVRAAIASGKN